MTIPTLEQMIEAVSYVWEVYREEHGTNPLLNANLEASIATLRRLDASKAENLQRVFDALADAPNSDDKFTCERAILRALTGEADG